MRESGRLWTMHQAESLQVLWEHEADHFDALICDPPYSSGGFVRGDRMLSPTLKYSKSDKSADGYVDFDGDNRDQRGYLAWCGLWLSECLRIVKPGAPAAVWSDWRQLPVTTDALQAGGFVWRGIGVWSKNSASRPQMGRFRNDAEFLIWGSRGPMRDGAEVGVLDGVWTCAPVNTASRLHVTEKPLEVMLAIVEIASPGGIILDPFAGSGTTGVAAIRNGRRFVGVERNPHYFRVACDRLRAEENGHTIEQERAGQLTIFGSEPVPT